MALALGLVGAGRWGRNYIRALAGLGEAKLAAVASNNPQTRDLVPPDCRIVPDWRGLLDLGLDGLIISSPAATHAEILTQAAARGLPALVEKPVCTSAAEADAIRAAVARKPATILIDHVHLFHPAFRELVRLAQQGRIRGIRASAGNRGPVRADVSTLWDWGPHDVAMCLALVPGAAAVTSARRLGRGEIEGGHADDIAFALRLAGGIPADLRVSGLAERHRWFAVDLDGRTLMYRDYTSVPLAILPAGAGPETPGEPCPTPAGRPLDNAILDFCAMIRARDTGTASLDLGLSTVAVLAAVDAALAS